MSFPWTEAGNYRSVSRWIRGWLRNQPGATQWCRRFSIDSLQLVPWVLWALRFQPAWSCSKPSSYISHQSESVDLRRNLSRNWCSLYYHSLTAWSASELERLSRGSQGILGIESPARVSIRNKETALTCWLSWFRLTVYANSPFLMRSQGSSSYQ